MSLRKYKRPLAKHNTCLHKDEGEAKACKYKNRTYGGPPLDDNDIAKAQAQFLSKYNQIKFSDKAIFKKEKQKKVTDFRKLLKSDWIE